MWSLVVWCFVGSFSVSAEVTKIDTDVGTYELVRLPGVSQSFDLTDSRRIGVRSGGDAQGQRRFYTFATESPDKTVAERSVPQAREWVVLGDELYVACREQLEVLRLPDLKPLASRSLKTRTTAPPSGRDVTPSVRLTLAASVNAQQNVLIVNGVEPVKDLAMPFWLRVDEEQMKVMGVDDFRGQLTVVRSRGVSHSVTAEVVTVAEPQEALLGGQPRRVPQGWYLDGYVFDNRGTEVRCIFDFRQASRKSDWRQSVVADNLRPLGGNLRRPRSNQGAASIPLETVPANLRIVASPQSLAVQIWGYDGGYDSTGIHDQFVIEPSPGSTPSNLRVDGEDVCFVVGEVGYHLRVVEFDAFTCDIPTPQRLAFDQPAMVLDDLPVIPMYTFLDGPDTHPVSTSSSLHGQSDARAAVEEEARLFLLERFNGRGSSIAEFKSRLADYCAQVDGEFERTVGRSPNGVPIPYLVQAQTSWKVSGIGRDELTYSVWREWPEQELIQLLFEDVLAEQQKQELARKRREIQEQKQRERQQQELERERIAKEREERRRAVEQARMERQRQAFLQSLVARRRVAGTLCIASVICFFLVRVRRGQGVEQ